MPKRGTLSMIKLRFNKLLSKWILKEDMQIILNGIYLFLKKKKKNKLKKIKKFLS